LVEGGDVLSGRRMVSAALALVSGLSLAACSSSGGGTSTSVFDIKPGECFVAPTAVKAELSDLSQVPCTEAHTQESYARVSYQAAGDTGASADAGAYPGPDALDKYAKGACAQRFTAYVGVDYLESKLFFTYLLPSARSWEQDNDRTILCFVTTTGGTLTASVKGSKR
jgi:hypothetical protein